MLSVQSNLFEVYTRTKYIYFQYLMGRKWIIILAHFGQSKNKVENYLETTDSDKEENLVNNDEGRDHENELIGKSAVSGWNICSVRK